YYVAATFLARCYTAAVLDPKLGPVKRSELMHTYKQKVLEVLRDAHRKGFRKADELRLNPAFGPLLDDPEFKQFLRELEEKGGLVEENDVEFLIDLEQLGQLPIDEHLAQCLLFLGNNGEPTAHALFDRDNGHAGDLGLRNGGQAINKTTTALTFGVLQHSCVI